MLNFFLALKKIVSVLLLLVYMLSIPGVAYSLHFCGEKLTSYSYKAPEKKSCVCKPSKTGQKTPAPESKCCEDQQVQLSTENSKVSSFDFKLSAPAYNLLPLFFLPFLSRLIYSCELAFWPETSHTYALKVPLFLLNRYFRIWFPLLHNRVPDSRCSRIGHNTCLFSGLFTFSPFSLFYSWYDQQNHFLVYP